MAILSLAIKSLWARKITAILTVISIAAAVLLFVAVENLRQGARTSFERTISDTDVIVGARSSPINLVLYSVFQIGDPTNNVTWETYQDVKSRQDVDWVVPISLGDSHRGFRVVGTTPSYFKRYKYADSQTLSFQDGIVFEGLFDVVLGAQVARELEYSLNSKLTLAHGLGGTSFVNHDDLPFTVTGILKPTGTPVDRSVFVSLGAIEAIHLGWRNGMPTPLSRMSTANQLEERTFVPESITAMLIGATSRVQILGLQRDLNTYKAEPLQAVIPGVALSQLWNVVSLVERALALVSGFVIAVGLIGILTSILTSLNERRREMAILRAMGARGRHVVGLLVSEAALLAFTGSVLGLTALYGLMWVLRPFLETRFNISALSVWPSQFDLGVIIFVTATSAVLGLVPALIALKRSLSDGLTIRV
ncbi:ABC transporter permease [Litorimonas haliclonae]|uniref:ABC transporter permease n=1 Tax=Litorimonas haliclonae TaxID=2081977 RepID=UPI0039EE7D42